MKETFKEVTKKLNFDLTAFEIPFEKIDTNLSLNLNAYRSKSTIFEHITNKKSKPSKLIKKNILDNFTKLEMQQLLCNILPYLAHNNDLRIKYLLSKGRGPFCKILVSQTHKRLIKKSKGVYCFYDKNTFLPLYFGRASKSYNRFIDYFSITTGNCMFNGQATSVRINSLINEFIIEGNSLGLAVLPMSDSKSLNIHNEEKRLISKFKDSHSLWNINKS